MKKVKICSGIFDFEIFFAFYVKNKKSVTKFMLSFSIGFHNGTCREASLGEDYSPDTNKRKNVKNSNFRFKLVVFILQSLLSCPRMKTWLLSMS